MAIVVGCYRALLGLYPKSFRSEYRDEMIAVFAERWRQASLGSRVFLAMSTIPDVMLNAAVVHWDLTRQDLRYALRWLRAEPGFAATAIVIIALGIGANTAVFSIADFVLIRPLPFQDPDRLVKVLETTPGYSGMELSPGNYRDWKKMNTVASAMATYTTFSQNLTGSGMPERLEVGLVSADVFSVLGVAPIIGHEFSATDDVPGAPGTTVLTYAIWQARFGGDPAIIGRTISLDDKPYVVLGVMPAAFRFPSSETALWIPQRFPEVMYGDRANNLLDCVARLRPGVTLAQARADFVRVAAILEAQFPRDNERTSANVSWLRDDFSTQSRFLLLALGGAAVCVLLIVCANLANLLIARAIGRRRELAVRAALGAGRERIVRQLVTESLVLAMAGGALGVALAMAGVPLLAQLVPISLPIAHAPSVDLRVLMFAAALTIVTGCAFGVMPVLRLGRTVDVGGLRGDGRSGAGPRERVRSVLVVAEVALSVVLLVSAGLLVRALWNVQHVDPGFRSSGVLTMRTDLPHPRYDDHAVRLAFYDRVLTGVRALPGVTSAAYIGGLPLVRHGGVWPIALKGEAAVRGEDTASLRFVTPDYFKTLGIPLKLGRDVRVSDTVDRQKVAVVSESFARRCWPGEDPIGRTFTIASAERTVIGVAGDVHVRGLEHVSEPQVYVPQTQIPDLMISGYAPNDLAVRTDGDAAALAAPVRAIVNGIDPEQPISDVQTIDQIVLADSAPRGVQLRVLAGLAALAMLLAAIGIHGLLSFAVSQRTQEIGMRMALGADRRAILGMITRQAAVLVVTGVVLGSVLAYAAGRAMQSLLAGVSPADGWTFGVAIGAAILFELSGSLVSAIRASRVNPVTAIRA
jgi:putative ABC transport system permease protein